MKVCSR